MFSWKQWGVWRSFNEITEVVMDVVSLVLLFLILYLIYNLLRPICGICKKRMWFYEAEDEPLHHKGGDSFEILKRHETCKRKDNSNAR